jgi:hypothetical protein
MPEVTNQKITVQWECPTCGSPVSYIGDKYQLEEEGFLHLCGNCWNNDESITDRRFSVPLKQEPKMELVGDVSNIQTRTIPAIVDETKLNGDYHFVLDKIYPYST